MGCDADGIEGSEVLTEQLRRWGARAIQAATLCAGAGVFLFYVNRLFPELPLYAGDEGAYLIRALYGDRLLSHPDAYRQLQSVDNAVYFFLMRLVDALSLNVLSWLRLIGAASYFGGLGLLYTLAVKACGRTTALGFLLIAALFPFYRFVFTAMPEGLPCARHRPRSSRRTLPVIVDEADHRLNGRSSSA